MAARDGYAVSLGRLARFLVNCKAYFAAKSDLDAYATRQYVDENAGGPIRLAYDESGGTRYVSLVEEGDDQ